MIAFFRRFFQAQPKPAPANDDRFARPRFRAGTKIICPQCDHHIATAKEDVFGHDTIKSAPWGLPTCSKMICPQCGAWYCRASTHVVVAGRFFPAGMQLHTDEGWR